MICKTKNFHQCPLNKATNEIMATIIPKMTRKPINLPTLSFIFFNVGTHLPNSISS